MYICFIDESGTPPNKPNSDKPYFTLGAAIIQASAWKKVSDRVMGFKIRNKLRGELKWRYFSPHNSSATNPMLDRPAEERKNLSLEFAHLVAGLQVSLLACVTDVPLAFRSESVNDQQSLYHFAYKPITERFEYFLQDAGSCGIVVADHRGRNDDRLLRAHHERLTDGRTSNSSRYDRFVEGLFLQDSEHSVGIQIADYVAGAVHRAYSIKDNQTASLLKGRFRKSPKGKVLGYDIVHHPKSRFSSVPYG